MMKLMLKLLLAPKVLLRQMSSMPLSLVTMTIPAA
jgi:hypothetical protein